MSVHCDCGSFPSKGIKNGLLGQSMKNSAVKFTVFIV